MRRRGGGKVFLVLAGLALVGWLGWSWLQSSLPQTDGTLAVPGLEGAVTVARDPHGIPHIHATSEHDAYLALGFVHAQDRLWQMELNRRVGAGRLAEVVGERALPSDRFLRTLGLYRRAEDTLAAVGPETRAALDAYAEGVNAFLDQRSGALPPEFLVLHYRPEPWKPVDSLVWAKTMAMQLSGNWSDELLHQRVATMLPEERVKTLWPGTPAGAPTTTALADGVVDQLLAAIPESIRARTASNEWVVAGNRTISGKPILANDPHLGFHAPILWYLVSIDAPGLQVAGATVPGVPFHVLGHNQAIAWGMTTTQGDTQDLFVEHPAGADAYETPQGPQPFDVHDETIAVQGQAAVTLTVRETRHGPVVSDVLGDKAQGQVLALSAAALAANDRSPQAMYRVNHAQNWAGFVAALAEFSTPQQNFTYADTSGAIGFYTAGRSPLRKSGDGALPVPGWTGDYDWTGWVPFAELPHAFNPDSGVIVNANNKPMPDGYPYSLGATWPDPYRARRIQDMLTAQPRFAPEDFASGQMDTLSLAAVELLPILLTADPQTAAGRAAMNRLRKWDGRMDMGRPEPLIYAHWLKELNRALLAEPLGPVFAQFSLPRPPVLKAILAGEGGWCADFQGGCPVLASAALDQVAATLGQKFGPDIDLWRWGAVHKATFDHPLFRHLPLLSGLTRLEVDSDGDDQTVSRGTYVADGPDAFRHTAGAGLRAVYDLANLDASRFMIATGQSGNPFSLHYDDLLETWRDGATLRLPTTAQAATLPSQLLLEPKR